MVRALTVVMPNLIRTSEINHLSIGPCLESPKKADDKIITKIARTRYPALSRDYSFVETPAALLPVSFSGVGLADSPSEPPLSRVCVVRARSAIFARTASINVVARLTLVRPTPLGVEIQMGSAQ